MFFSIFLLAKAAKLHISRQRYCFFRIYASAKHIFLIKSHISLLFLLPFPCHLGKYHPPLHLILYTTPTTFTSQNDANNTLFRIKTCIYQPKALLLQRESNYSPHKNDVNNIGTMEHKSCPRCGAAFICQHENPAKCQCAGVVLSPAARAHLAEQYPNQCLCRKCLLELSV